MLPSEEYAQLRAQAHLTSQKPQALSRQHTVRSNSSRHAEPSPNTRPLYQMFDAAPSEGTATPRSVQYTPPPPPPPPEHQVQPDRYAERKSPVIPIESYHVYACEEIERAPSPPPQPIPMRQARVQRRPDTPRRELRRKDATIADMKEQQGVTRPIRVEANGIKNNNLSEPWSVQNENPHLHSAPCAINHIKAITRRPVPQHERPSFDSSKPLTENAPLSARVKKQARSLSNDFMKHTEAMVQDVRMHARRLSDTLDEKVYKRIREQLLGETKKAKVGKPRPGPAAPSSRYVAKVTEPSRGFEADPIMFERPRSTVPKPRVLKQSFEKRGREYDLGIPQRPKIQIPDEKAAHFQAEPISTWSPDTVVANESFTAAATMAVDVVKRTLSRKGSTKSYARKPSYVATTTLTQPILTANMCGGKGSESLSLEPSVARKPSIKTPGERRHSLRAGGVGLSATQMVTSIITHPDNHSISILVKVLQNEHRIHAHEQLCQLEETLQSEFDKEFSLLLDQQRSSQVRNPTIRASSRSSREQKIPNLEFKRFFANKRADHPRYRTQKIGELVEGFRYALEKLLVEADVVDSELKTFVHLAGDVWRKDLEQISARTSCDSQLDDVGL